MFLCLVAAKSNGQINFYVVRKNESKQRTLPVTLTFLFSFDLFGGTSRGRTTNTCAERLILVMVVVVCGVTLPRRCRSVHYQRNGAVNCSRNKIRAGVDHLQQEVAA